MSFEKKLPKLLNILNHKCDYFIIVHLNEKLLKESLRIKVKTELEIFKNPYRSEEIYFKELKGTFHDALKQRKVLAVYNLGHTYVLFDIDSDGTLRLKGNFMRRFFISYYLLKLLMSTR